MFVVVRQRRSGRGRAKRLTVNAILDRTRAAAPARNHAAQPAERTSACSSTVRVADSCLSGG